MNVWLRGWSMHAVSKNLEKRVVIAVGVLVKNFWKKNIWKPSGPSALYHLNDLIEEIISAFDMGWRRWWWSILVIARWWFGRLEKCYCQ